MPLASSPLSLASGVGGALLSLSHPDSDNSSLSLSSDDASGGSGSASSVGGAASVALSPSLDDLGSSDVECFLYDNTSGELLVSSSEDGASSSISHEGLNLFVDSSSGEALGPLSVVLSVDGACGAGLGSELSDDTGSKWLADLS